MGIDGTDNGGWDCRRGRVADRLDGHVSGGDAAMSQVFDVMDYLDAALSRWDIELKAQQHLAMPTCGLHARYLDSTGLCPTCQREAKQQAETRANNEAVRRIAVEAEAAVLAEMYQL